MQSRKLRLPLTALAGSLASSQENPDRQTANMILRGGHIISVDPHFGGVEGHGHYMRLGEIRYSRESR
ncbi:MAG: hypothetical protein ACYTG5_13935 [Planctomycetota bacterium]